MGGAGSCEYEAPSSRPMRAESGEHGGVVKRGLWLGILGSLLVVCAGIAIALTALGVRIGLTRTLLTTDAAIVSRLQTVLDPIRSLHVEGYQNKDWCRNLTYSKGAFSDTTEPATCDVFQRPGRPFGAQAQRDFEALRQALDTTGFEVERLYVEYGPGNDIAVAEFDGHCPFCSAVNYVYSPRYKIDVPDQGFPVDQDWFYFEEHGPL